MYHQRLIDIILIYCWFFLFHKDLELRPRGLQSRMARHIFGVTKLSSGPTNISYLLWTEELQNEETEYR